MKFAGIKRIYITLLILLLIILCLPGCSMFGKTIDNKPSINLGYSAALLGSNQTKQQFVYSRPVLVIHQLNDDDKSQADKVVKAYVATVKQLVNYAEQLEKIVDQLQTEQLFEYE